MRDSPDEVPSSSLQIEIVAGRHREGGRCSVARICAVIIHALVTARFEKHQIVTKKNRPHGWSSAFCPPPPQKQGFAVWAFSLVGGSKRQVNHARFKYANRYDANRSGESGQRQSFVSRGCSYARPVLPGTAGLRAISKRAMQADGKSSWRLGSGFSTTGVQDLSLSALCATRWRSIHVV
jgi:hypothetical protein